MGIRQRQRVDRTGNFSGGKTASESGQDWTLAVGFRQRLRVDRTGL